MGIKPGGRRFLLEHFGVNSTHTNATTRKPHTDAIDTQTFFLAVQDLFVVEELECDVDEGPLACCGPCLPGGDCFPGVCRGVGKKGVPESVGVDVVGDVGGANGAALLLVLNRFPLFLKSKMTKLGSSV